jgi:hypothetical protein
MRASGVSLLKVLAAAAVALLAGDVLSPVPVEASCGHYVLTHPRGEFARAEEGVPQPPPPPPCSGPECSRGDDMPVSSPQVAPPASENWGCLAALPLLEAADLAHLLTPASLPPACDANSAIFHPPR